MKRVAFLFGVILLTLAFLVTGAELAARTILGPGQGGATALMSTQLVWQTVAPQSFLKLIDSTYWSYVKPALTLPGWVLFGVPGLALAIGFRHRDADSLTRDQEREHEESLYLFDELADAARKEGYANLPDDMAPSNPADTVPAEAHYAENPVEDDLLTDRDYLLDPVKLENHDRSRPS